MRIHGELLRTLHYMQSFPQGPYTAARLGRGLQISVATAQRHLATLEQAGYVARPDGSAFPFFHVTNLGMHARGPQVTSSTIAAAS